MVRFADADSIAVCLLKDNSGPRAVTQGCASFGARVDVRFDADVDAATGRVVLRQFEDEALALIVYRLRPDRKLS
jgi:hypothetical protein